MTIELETTGGRAVRPDESDVGGGYGRRGVGAGGESWDTTMPGVGESFRRVLGRVPTAVAVISGMERNAPVGVSVGTFSSVSLQPPLVGFFIADTSTTWPRIEPTGRFCASVLSAPQESISRLFATPGKDRFGLCDWETSPGGLPIISGCAAWLECTIADTHRSGDHTLILGHVDRMTEALEDAEPLVFISGSYARPVRLGDIGSTAQSGNVDGGLI